MNADHFLENLKVARHNGFHLTGEATAKSFSFGTVSICGIRVICG